MPEMNREILFMTARVVTHSGAVQTRLFLLHSRVSKNGQQAWPLDIGARQAPLREPNKTVARDVVGQCVVLEHQAARALVPRDVADALQPILLELHHHTVEEQPLRHFKKCPRRGGTHVSEPTLRRGRRAPSDKGVVNARARARRVVWGSQTFGVACPGSKYTPLWNFR